MKKGKESGRQFVIIGMAVVCMLLAVYYIIKTNSLLNV